MLLGLTYAQFVAIVGGSMLAFDAPNQSASTSLPRVRMQRIKVLSDAMVY